MILSIIALSILILVHELGHFVAARWKGVSVAEFAIGYGPKLFAWTWGQTVFVLRAFPIGGYIKQHELALRPAGQKILVYLAGPAANLLFAYLAFLIAGIVGIPQLTTKIGMVFPDMPAAKAGFLPGDMVESVNGVRVERWVEWTGKVHESRHSEVVLVLNRQGQRIEARLTPTIREGRGVIGVKAAGETIPFRYGIGSFRYGAETVMQHLAGSVSMLKSLIKPAAESDIAGPLMVAKAGAEQASFGLMALLHFMGIVSTYLVIINLAPIPALDGGTILMALWEQASGKPVGMKIQRVLTAISGGLLVTLMLHALLKDIAAF